MYRFAIERSGYCPQFSALLDQLTGRNTIQLYARIHGIQESYIEHLTNCLGEMLLFTQYLDKEVGSYRYGSKMSNNKHLL